MTYAGSLTSTSDTPGRKLKVIVTAYIDDKKINQWVKAYETSFEGNIRNGADYYKKEVIPKWRTTSFPNLKQIKKQNIFIINLYRL